MRELTLMTCSMFFPVIVKLRFEQDPEGALELYEEMMDLAKDSDFTAVDVTSLETEMLGFDNVKSIVAARNLKVSSFIQFADYTQVKDEMSDEIIAKGKAGVDAAVALGAKVLMLAPMTQEDLSQYSRELLRERLVKHFTPIAKYAKENGIHCVIEDTENQNIPMCTIEDMKWLLDTIPEIELVYDSGNVLLFGGDSVEYFDTFVSRIGYVHFKDMMLVDAKTQGALPTTDGRFMQGAPSGKGLVDFKPLIEHVLASPYEGYITVEFNKAPEEAYLEGINRSKKYFMDMM